MDVDEAAKEIMRLSRLDSSRFVYFFNSSNIDVQYELSCRLIGAIEFVNVSSFCKSNDSVPDIISMMSELKNRNSPIILRGIDQYLAHRSKKEKVNLYRQLSSFVSSSGPLFVLTYNSQEVLKLLVENDLRLEGRIFQIGNDLIFSSWNLFVVTSTDFQLNSMYKGFKLYLEALESGICNPYYYVQTSHVEFLQDAQIPVTIIDSNQSLVRLVMSPETEFLDCSDDSVWKKYRNDFNSDSLATAYHIHFQNRSISETIFSLSSTFDYWIFISYFKNNYNFARYPYLSHSVERCNSVDDFRYHLLFDLLDYSPSHPDYLRIYNERKTYLSGLKVIKNINEYCSKVRSIHEGVESIYYFTDLNEREKESILDIVSDLGKVDQKLLTVLKTVYPDLFFYLSDYHFDSIEINDYFTNYRWFKVANLPPSSDFLIKVNENAVDPPYYQFPPRDAIFTQQFKNNDKVYFLDALGVEYIPFIEKLCSGYELDIKITVCRSNLPSTTEYNNRVLDSISREDNKKLDDLAHEESFSDDYNKSSRFISKQLSIIHEAIKHIHDSIKGNERYILYSDHGLSRLYVLSGQNDELIWSIQANHNGRCAPKLDSKYSDPFVKVESDNYVVANYSRIRNTAHKAKIEAHGGATLEEVLVPLCIISTSGVLFKDCDVPSEITLDPLTGIAKLEIYYPTDTNELYLFIDNRRISSMRKVNNYLFEITGLQVGTYSISVYDGNHHLKDSVVKVSGKGMKSNSLFSKLR